MLEREALLQVLPTIELPTLELPTEDGIPLETPWHRSEINLLIELTRCHWRDRTDFYTGGNMFIYYSIKQALDIATQPATPRRYRGPDFFVVKDVDGTRYRGAWVVWEEGGRYPDLIIELLSPSTAVVDRTEKKTLYERTFRTAEYYCYDPMSQELEGWWLSREGYEALTPGPEGWLWSAVLGLWLGRWEGVFQGERAVWLRFFDAEGRLVLTGEEAAEQRAEAAEAELAHLRVRLAELEGEM